MVGLCLLNLFIVACSPKSDALSGEWNGGDWGTVTIQGKTRAYSNTNGTGPGKMEFKNTRDRTYEGTWGESEKRHGTMRFTISEDGKTIGGNWKADEHCEINPGNQGTILWQRKQ